MVRESLKSKFEDTLTPSLGKLKMILRQSVLNEIQMLVPEL